MPVRTLVSWMPLKCCHGYDLTFRRPHVVLQFWTLWHTPCPQLQLHRVLEGGPFMQSRLGKGVVTQCTMGNRTQCTPHVARTMYLVGILGAPCTLESLVLVVPSLPWYARVPWYRRLFGVYNLTFLPFIQGQAN
jgi:hypothetical protein